MTDLHPVRRALISVSDKTGLVDLAKALADRGVELLSTGGSAGMVSPSYRLPSRCAAYQACPLTGYPSSRDSRSAVSAEALPCMPWILACQYRAGAARELCG